MVSVFGLLTTELDAIFKTMDKYEDPKKKLKMMINTIFEKLQEDQKFWSLYFHFVMLPELHEKASDLLGGFLENAFGLFENLFKLMGIKNAKEESLTFAALLDGVCFHYMFDTENYPIEKMRKFLIKKYCT